MKYEVNIRYKYNIPISLEYFPKTNSILDGSITNKWQTRCEISVASVEAQIPIRSYC